MPLIALWDLNGWLCLMQSNHAQNNSVVMGHVALTAARCLWQDREALIQ